MIGTLSAKPKSKGVLFMDNSHKPLEPKRPFTGPKYEASADAATRDTYSKQMRSLFGCTTLPAVMYKGELYETRSL